jgi:hypothetical protein
MTASRTIFSSIVVFVSGWVAWTTPLSAQDDSDDDDGPTPYEDVITEDAESDDGLFTVHRIDEKIYYEIPRAMLGRDMLFVADQRGTIRGEGYAGEEISNRIVRWERRGNRILFRLVSYAMQADTTSPVAAAVALSNVPPIL